MQVNQIKSEFYDLYGTEWTSSARLDLEKLTTSHKVSNLCSLMNGLKPKRILDFGCGTGDALNKLSNYFYPYDSIGVDISSTMIEFAKKQYPKLKFVQGDFQKLKDYQVDLITFIDILEHLEDIGTVLQEAKIHTKYIAIKIPLEKTWFIDLLNKLHLKENRSRLFESEGHLYEFNQVEVEEILSNVGLSIINIKTNFVPKDVHFSLYMKNRMKAKSGFIGKMKYYLYILFSKCPYGIIRRIFQVVNGVDLYVLCKT